jgi:hypothetical protein
MAQKVTVASTMTSPAARHRRRCGFAVGGTDYEIDLNNKNAAAFRQQLAPFIEYAARPGGPNLAGAGRTASNSLVISGPGQRAKASRSVSAGASRPA